MIVITVLSLVVIVVALYYVVYLLKKQRYAHIPGWETPLPMFFALLMKDFPLRNQLMFHELFDKFGDVWRVTFGFRTIVVVKDPDTLRAMLVTDMKNFPKQPPGHKVTARLGTNLFNTDGDVWRRQRVLINPAFNDAKIRFIHDEAILKISRVLINKWDGICEEGTGTGIVQPVAEMNNFAFDVMGCAGFGVDFNCLTTDRTDMKSNWYGSLEYQRFSRALGKTLFNLLLPVLTKFKRFDDMIKRSDGWVKMIEDLVVKGEKDLQEGTLDEGSLVALLLHNKVGDGQHQTLTTKECVSNASLFMIAGHETTANTLAWVMYYLAKHPDIQQKARAEAEGLLYADANGALKTDFDRVSTEAQFIKFVIMEALRLRSPAHMMLRHTIGEREINNVKIPAHTDMAISLLRIHTDPTYYDNPSEFYPDRWIGHDLKQLDKHYAPFSFGPRRCIGQKFAECELVTITAMILHNYNLSLPENQPEVKFVINVTLNAVPFDVIIEKRK